MHTPTATAPMSPAPLSPEARGWWLGLLSRAPEQPFRMVWQAELEADLKAATADELTALARQYLVPARALIVIGSSTGKPAATP